jgi:HlyD family secretion protein
VRDSLPIRSLGWAIHMPRRRWLWIAAAALALLGLVRAFAPEPVLVDTALVARGRLAVTLDDDGRTRVRERYTVSAPIQGRLLRTTLDPGDPVRAAESVVAEFAPVAPTLLDARSRAEAQARMLRAEARMREAQALREQAEADLKFAQAELARVRELRERDIQPLAAVEKAEREERRANEGLRASSFGVQVARFELEQARASVGEGPTAQDGAGKDGKLELRSPIEGIVLRVFEESSRTLNAGEPILEVGNTRLLEVVADYLSQDAVKIQPGMTALIAGWGGEGQGGEERVLRARVRLVEPAGFTKVSALGVEEQRVNVVLDPDGGASEAKPSEGQDAQAWAALGDGYRVEVRILLWEQENVLRVPTGALFRDGESWAVFAVEDDRAVLRRLELGRQNGLDAQVVSGLSEGDRVVLYPTELVRDGTLVEPRG